MCQYYEGVQGFCFVFFIHYFFSIPLSCFIHFLNFFYIHLVDLATDPLVNTKALISPSLKLTVDYFRPWDYNHVPACGNMHPAFLANPELRS